MTIIAWSMFIVGGLLTITRDATFLDVLGVVLFGMGAWMLGAL